MSKEDRCGSVYHVAPKEVRETVGKDLMESFSAFSFQIVVDEDVKGLEYTSERMQVNLGIFAEGCTLNRAWWQIEEKRQNVLAGFDELVEEDEWEVGEEAEGK
jgi:hypothetical protein